MLREARCSYVPHHVGRAQSSPSAFSFPPHNDSFPSEMADESGDRSSDGKILSRRVLIQWKPKDTDG